MKKLMAMLLTLAMLLSSAVICVVADETTFVACGNQYIEWDKDAASNITLDGSLVDWQNAGYTLNEITLDNLVPFDHVTNNTMPTNFKVSTYYVADADWLYVGFYVVDDDVQTYADNNIHNYGSGDCFQIAVDMNAECEKMLIEDPTYFDTIGADTENIFYSFAYPGDGVDLSFAAQNITGVTDLEERNEALTGNVKGKASKTDDGWCAEFALSWEMLFEDFFYKSFVDPEYMIRVDENNPLKLGISICYLNSNGTAPIGAAGTFKSYECKTNTVDGHGVDPTDNGLYLLLDYVPGMELNCSGIKTPSIFDDTETEPETDPSGETEPETIAPGKFTDMTKVENFAGRQNASHFSASDCELTFNDKGYVEVHAKWEDKVPGTDEDKTDVMGVIDIKYMRMMLQCFLYPDDVKTTADKQAMIPNSGDNSYSVVVFKVKRNDIAKDQFLYMDYLVGDVENGFGGLDFPRENVVANTEGDEFEYLVFDLSERTDFTSDYINTLRLVWMEDSVSEELKNAAMELHGVYLYETTDDAAAALNLTIPEKVEPETDPDTDPETDPETEPATKAPAASETEPAGDEGCSSVIGISAAAVVLAAAAAAVVLKKKED